MGVDGGSRDGGGRLVAEGTKNKSVLLGLWWSKRTSENRSRRHQCHRKKNDYDETGLNFS